MTTTSSRKVVSSVRLMVSGTSVALKVWVAYPMQLTSTVASGLETVNTKSPSKPVDTPLDVPFSSTVAP